MYVYVYVCNIQNVNDHFNSTSFKTAFLKVLLNQEQEKCPPHSFLSCRACDSSRTRHCSGPVGHRGRTDHCCLWDLIRSRRRDWRYWDAEPMKALVNEMGRKE